MPKVRGSAPLLRRLATTRASASAVAIGSNGSPDMSFMMSACSAGDTVIALPLRPRLKGAAIGTLICPSPRLEAIATGASRCAASNRPILSLSRTFDHDTSRTSATSSPSAAANPLSTATIRAAASASGMKPMRSGQDRLRDLADFLLFAHRRRPQQYVGLVFGQALQFHEDTLGAIDHLAVFKRGFGAVELILQLREGVEARNAEIEDRLDAFLLQSVDDIGGDPGIDGCLYRRRVALIDEHRDRPAHGAADLEHLFQNVAAGIFQIDQNDVGIECIDSGQQTLHFADVDDAGKTRFPQPLLEDRGADRAFVDNDDFRRRLGAHRSPVFRQTIHSTPKAGSKPCNYEQLGLAPAHQLVRWI